MVLTTTPPHPASNARMMLASDSVGGADASRKGFSKSMPVNRVASVVFMGSLWSAHHSAFRRRFQPPRVRREAATAGLAVARRNCVASGGGRLWYLPPMGRIVRGGLIQVKADVPLDGSTGDVKRRMIDKHMPLVEQAGKQGVQVLCLQELFYGPYFCAEQKTRWYELTEPIPDGPTTTLFRDVAKRLGMVIVLPIYEVENTGVYYNTAAVIDADGRYLGKYRKHHIPQVAPGFWEKYYFRPGNTGYPVFQTAAGKIGVYICYDRHFPEGARILGLNGAEIVFNPSATVAGLSEYLWKLEQPAHAVANGYFVGAINRVGTEAPWNIGEFYGQSYFCDPRGRFVAEASRDRDELIVADLDLDVIREVRDTWQFYRDRRPETYSAITAL